MAQRRNDFTSSLLERRDRFWSRLSAARRREQEQGQASKAAIQAGRDGVVSFFRRAERREDDQTRRNKNFISRIVNGKNFLSLPLSSLVVFQAGETTSELGRRRKPPSPRGTRKSSATSSAGGRLGARALQVRAR